MHLIDKDPVPKNALKKALTNKISDNYTTNPLLKKVPYKPKAKPREIQIRTVPTPKPQRMKQYGDKGYKPATGEGTSH